MAEIKVTPIDDATFQVTVTGKSTTTHKVKVQADYAQKLTGGEITTVQLVKKSFEFLLEREPNTSILSNFDLSVIARYFPEYERIIGK